MAWSGSILVCFALPEEARPFELMNNGRPGVRILRTGMGKRNAVESVRTALTEDRVSLVLTCGFAGGLNPMLNRAAVVYASGKIRTNGGVVEAFVPAIEDAGARRARFHWADRMVITAAEKRALWTATGADAVEMESGAIQCLCEETAMPCVTVRVISDAAQEDLPLDFNALMRADCSLDLKRLMLVVARSPRLIHPLLRLRRHSRDAALQLAQALDRAIGRLGI